MGKIYISSHQNRGVMIWVTVCAVTNPTPFDVKYYEATYFVPFFA